MRKPVFALISVMIVSAVSWGVLLASIWLPVDDRALPAVRTTAAVSAVAVMLLLSMRWLRTEGMTYLLNAVITQRARPTSRDRCAPTLPLERPRRVPPAWR